MVELRLDGFVVKLEEKRGVKSVAVHGFPFIVQVTFESEKKQTQLSLKGTTMSN